MYKVGITGGIGSGKTTICQVFETLGIPIYYADERAKALMTGNKKLKKEIISIFGADSYFLNGRLNRKFISSLAFDNASLLKELNAVVHPAVALDGEKWFYELKHDLPYAIKEAALLIESKSYLKLDKLIVVVCPDEIRLQRAAARDKSKLEDIRKRMAQQLSDSEREKFADFVILNDGKHSLIEQVMKIHSALI